MRPARWLPSAALVSHTVIAQPQLWTRLARKGGHAHGAEDGHAHGASDSPVVGAHGLGSAHGDSPPALEDDEGEDSVVDDTNSELMRPSYINVIHVE